MNFIWNSIPLATLIVSLVFISLIYGFIFFLFSKLVTRKFPYISVGILFILVVLAYLFEMNLLVTIFIVITGFIVVLTLNSNIGVLRNYLSNIFKPKAYKERDNYIIASKDIIEITTQVVLNLSASKTGAIITFERKVNLEDFYKSGILIEAPVNEELLETIFYPGTRLHDGAVIISNGIIKAASVFFTPTTKSYSKKYGSRHRAAIGISEVSDSVTVVVSEETGKISIAADGVIERIPKEKFRDIFEKYMKNPS